MLPSSHRRQPAPAWLPRWQLIFLLCAGQAGAVADLSMAELRQHARFEAPKVTAQQARVSAAEQRAARAAALPDPSVMLGIDNLTISGAEALQLGADTMTMRRVGFRQAWPSRTKREARRALADAFTEAARGDLRRQRYLAELDAGQAWIAVWTAEAERSLWQELKTESERAVNIATAQFGAASASAADALAAQAALLEVEVMLQAVEADVGAARADLARWYPEARDRPLAALPDLTALRLPIIEYRRQLEQQAPLQAWPGRSRAALAAVSLAEADKRPDLGFGLSYGARSAGLPDMLMFEVSIDLPLFTRDRQDRDVAAKRAEAEAVRAEYDDALRRQQAELERLIAEWRSLLDQVNSYEQRLLPLSRDRSRLSLSGFAHGAPLQPWLDARSAEIRTARDALMLRSRLAERWLQLDALLPDRSAIDPTQEFLP